jgi:ABC-type cobalamin/Fe3+-siderophores transport system ATPase subunit
VEHLAATGLEEVIASPVEDSIELSLLDGDEYKSTERMSTGQRCTVVLPILLAQRERALIVDQPEDHLDNAFIVETVIKAIRSRGDDAQLVFSTHNPNIPVLGDADLVVLLGSDGTRGFVQHEGSLEHPATVDAISTVMEGGREAFEKRAAFYRGASTQ